ncbi:FAD-dependent oxidoreductase [Streptomyces sudanensis]|nr:FAD-dependent oxidoreductase [Streptomyces sudanensis]
MTGDRPDVAVVGGGIAGLAAATALAERGVRVTLYEREETLGGRVRGWRTRLADGSEATMSRGFHAFFRQYYNLRGLLRRTDPGLDRLVPLPDYPLRHRRGLTDGFARVPRTPPWSALGFAALSPTFGWRDLAGMAPRAALPLFDVRVPEVYERFDRVGAADLLERIRFPEAARHLAFEVFSRSFFADPRGLSAAELMVMFHIYFLGSSEGLLFDVPGEPYPQALWEPLGGYLEGLGADVRTGTPVLAVRPDGEHLVVEADGGAAGTGRWCSPWTPGPCAPWSRRPRGSAAARGARTWGRCGRRRRSSCRGCGWTGRCGGTGRGSSAPAATAAWTTSASWSAGRGRRRAGPRGPAGRWWSCTRTPSTRGPSGRTCRTGWWSSCTRCTRRRGTRGPSTRGTSGGRTARCSPSAPTTGARPSARPTRGSWRRATRSAATCRSP